MARREANVTVPILIDVTVKHKAAKSNATPKDKEEWERLRECIANTIEIGRLPMFEDVYELEGAGSIETDFDLRVLVKPTVRSF